MTHPRNGKCRQKYQTLPYYFLNPKKKKNAYNYSFAEGFFRQ